MIFYPITKVFSFFRPYWCNKNCTQMLCSRRRTSFIKNPIEWKRTLILFIFWPYWWIPKLVQILVLCYWTTSIKQMPAHIKFDFWVNMLTLSFNFMTLYMSTTLGAKPGCLIPLPISLSRSLIPTLWKRVGSEQRIPKLGPHVQTCRHIIPKTLLCKRLSQFYRNRDGIG